MSPGMTTFEKNSCNHEQRRVLQLVVYTIKVNCGYVCVCVLTRRPPCWTYRAEIWHGRPHLPLGGYMIHFVPIPLPTEWFCRSVQPKPAKIFCENFIKQKLKGTPANGVRCPAAGPSGLGTLTTWVWGPKNGVPGYDLLKH